MIDPLDPNTFATQETGEVMDAIDAALGELTIEEVIDEPSVIEELAFDTELPEDEARVLESEITKMEVYEEAPAGDEAAEAAEAIDEAKTEKKAKEPRKPKEKKERAVRDLASLPASAFILEDGFTGDLELNKAEVIARKPTQKKIAEKFENLFLAVSAGNKPSTYTMDLFRVLDAKKEATSSDFINTLTSTKSNRGDVYAEGTARSQTGQIMTLFPAVGIAKREGSKLTIREDSSLVKALRKFL